MTDHHWALVQTVAPSTEPVTTAEAKTHLRVDHTDDDTYIGDLVTAARLWAEDHTRRQFVTATWRLALDRFPSSDSDAIEVPRPPLSSISSITYTDEDGATQTWAVANYQVDSDAEPARVLPAWNKSYPTTRAEMNAVAVTFIAGYGAASAVPEAIKTAIKLLAAHLYEQRAPIVTGTIVSHVGLTLKSLLAPYRVHGF